MTLLFHHTVLRSRFSCAGSTISSRLRHYKSSSLYFTNLFTVLFLFLLVEQHFQSKVTAVQYYPQIRSVDSGDDAFKNHGCLNPSGWISHRRDAAANI